jgi:hypothetical protein
LSTYAGSLAAHEDHLQNWTKPPSGSGAGQLAIGWQPHSHTSICFCWRILHPRASSSAVREWLIPVRPTRFSGNPAAQSLHRPSLAEAVANFLLFPGWHLDSPGATRLGGGRSVRQEGYFSIASRASKLNCDQQRVRGIEHKNLILLR